jgi:hypothetical protein
MQQIAAGEGWDTSDANALFENAIAFEPHYYSYYQMMAYYLQGKWHGKEGDPERFAKATADRVGGEEGDILYFKAAIQVSCACDSPETGYFSWSRMQKGFAALEKQYGPSLINTNYAAQLASEAKEWIDAELLFKRIGENWDKDVWNTEQWFKQVRECAVHAAPILARTRQFKKDAEQNISSAAGQAYLPGVETKLKPFEETCIDKAEGDFSKFRLFLEVGKGGTAQYAYTENGTTAIAMCIMKGLYTSYLRKETPLPTPPSDPYRVIVEIDPATLKAAAK